MTALIAVMAAWWSDVIKESTQGGYHTPVVQISLRYGMILFIASEVMFFVAWFWAFFDASLFPGDAIEYSRAEFTGGVWPPKGTEVLDPWHFPLHQHADSSDFGHDGDLGASRPAARATVSA